jgi:hypothetical protein
MIERIDWERENEAARQFIYHNLRNMNFCGTTLEGLYLFMPYLNRFGINTLLIQKNGEDDDLYILRVDQKTLNKWNSEDK